MQNNAKIGGILSIVAGAFGVIGALIFVAATVMMGFLSNRIVYEDPSAPEEVFVIMAAFYGIFAFLGVLVSALAIVGGVFALKRKNWGLALAGAIAGTLAFLPCGIPAIIFIAMGKQEFDTSPKPAAPAMV